MDYTERIEALKSLISERIVVIDGPRGTAIQAYNLEARHFGGPEYDGCNEYLTSSSFSWLVTVPHTANCGNWKKKLGFKRKRLGC